MARPERLFWHKLALALGGRTIAEWQEVMSAEEFMDWVIYYDMEPFGGYRGDVNAAFVCSIIANVNAQKGKRFQPKEFMPKFVSRYQASGPAMTPDQILTKFQEMAERT